MKKSIIHSALQLGAVAIVAVVVLSPLNAAAHDIDRKNGFYVGGSLMGASIDADDTLDDDFTIDEGGAGINLRMGWLFNPKFSLEMVLGGQFHETSDSNLIAGLGMFNILAYYHFRGDQHLRPFIKGGFGGYGLNFGEEEDTGANLPSVTGAGLVFGGGIEYFLGNHFSLGADVTHHIINYERKELDLGDGLIQGTELDENGSATQFALFMTIYI